MPAELPLRWLIHSREGRLHVIDGLRGVACVIMVVFHGIVFGDMAGLIDIRYTSLAMLAMEYFVQIVFIFAMGLSASLGCAGKRENRSLRLGRTALMSAGAIVISATTYALDADNWVRFGLLHYAVVARLIWPARLTRDGLPALAASVGVLSAYVGLHILFEPVDSVFLAILGFPGYRSYGYDFIPLVPWVALSFLGMVAGAVITRSPALQSRLAWRCLPEPVLWLGRNSLLVYMLHIPLIFALMKVLARWRTD